MPNDNGISGTVVPEKSLLMSRAVVITSAHIPTLIHRRGGGGECHVSRGARVGLCSHTCD